jgi:hypothetical protein
MYCYYYSHAARKTTLVEDEAVQLCDLNTARGTDDIRHPVRACIRAHASVRKEEQTTEDNKVYYFGPVYSMLAKGLLLIAVASRGGLTLRRPRIACCRSIPPRVRSGQTSRTLHPNVVFQKLAAFLRFEKPA